MELIKRGWSLQGLAESLLVRNSSAGRPALRQAHDNGTIGGTASSRRFKSATFLEVPIVGGFTTWRPAPPPTLLHAAPSEGRVLLKVPDE